MVHFTRFFLNTLLGMGGFFIDVVEWRILLQRVEPHRFWQYATIMAWVWALYATSVLRRQLHAAKIYGDMADLCIRCLVVDLANVHRKWTIEG